MSKRDLRKRLRRRAEHQARLQVLSGAKRIQAEYATRYEDLFEALKLIPRDALTDIQGFAEHVRANGSAGLDNADRERFLHIIDNHCADDYDEFHSLLAMAAFDHRETHIFARLQRLFRDMYNEIGPEPGRRQTPREREIFDWSCGVDLDILFALSRGKGDDPTSRISQEGQPA